MVFNMNTQYRWVINKVQKNQYKFVWEAAATEVDNYDDTHCFGSNFLPISFTSEDWTVYPFLPEDKEELNVPIRTVFTDLKCYYREVFIL